MTSFQFQGHTFKMQKVAQTFFEKYLTRIDAYAKRYSLDPILVDDIYQTILEKLLELPQPFSQKDLVSLVNTMGEPEDIFGEEEQSRAYISSSGENVVSSQKDLKIEKKSIVQPWFLGVCSWLSEITKFPVWIYRIVFTALLFCYTIGFWLYGFLFFLKLFFAKKGTIKEEIATWFLFLCRMISRFFLLIWRFVVRFFTVYLWKIIAFCFWLLLFFLLGFAVALGIGALGFLFSDATILNQSFSQLLPWYASWSLLFVLLVLVLWDLFCLERLFKKHLISSFLLILSIFVFLAGLLGLSATVFSLMSAYENAKQYTLTHEFLFPEIVTTQPLSLGIHSTTSSSVWGISPDVKIILNPGDTLSSEVIFSYFAKDEQDAKKIEYAILRPEFSGELNDFFYSWSGNSLFSEKVPFSFPSVTIYVTVPLGIQVENSPFIRNVWCSSYHDVILYDEFEGFVCLQDQRKEQAKSLLKEELLSAFSSFSGESLPVGVLEEEIDSCLLKYAGRDFIEEKELISSFCIQDISSFIDSKLQDLKIDEFVKRVQEEYPGTGIPDDIWRMKFSECIDSFPFTGEDFYISCIGETISHQIVVSG